MPKYFSQELCFLSCFMSALKSFLDDSSFGPRNPVSIALRVRAAYSSGEDETAMIG